MKARLFDKLASAPKRRDDLMPYLRCLTNPSAENAARLPDHYSFPTGLLHSRQTISVIGNSGATDQSDLGRFSFAVSPTVLNLGVVNTARVYQTVNTEPYQTKSHQDFVQGSKVVMVDPAANWSALGAAFNLSPGDPELLITLGDPNNTPGLMGTDANNYLDGDIQTLRPVAMSVWYENTLSDLACTGDVVICLVPPSSLNGQYVPVNFNQVDYGAIPPVLPVFSGQGPLYNWEQLANVPGSYSGKLKDGGYAFWVPSCVEDTDFFDKVENALTDFPVIYVSGQVGGGATASIPEGAIGKLQIETVFEYTTNAQYLDQSKSPCVIGALDKIKAVLYDQPTAMANDEHLAWWRRLLGAALKGGQGFFESGPAGALRNAGEVILA